MQPAPISMFKTPEGQARYFAAYDATLALWPVAVTPMCVPTRFGDTHVNTCGPQDAPPLLLLHGAAVSSTMWYPNIAALSRDHRVYAPDIIGEMGKSTCTRPVRQPAEYVHWLSDLLDGLHIERAAVVGISLGGYLAALLAIACPERVSKLVLLSPAGLLRIHSRFYLRMAAAVLVPFLSPGTRQALFMGTDSPNAAPVIRQLMTPSGFRYRMSIPRLHTDGELGKIQAPTLLLLGEHEVIYNPHKALPRARRLIPRVEAEVIPAAGHALSLDQPEIVNRRILEFLDGASQ